MRSSISVGVVICIVFVLAGSASPQSIAARVHQSTPQPREGRFAIVQSPLAARWTFRLDRYTGNVDQLVKIRFGGVTWQKMSVLDLPDTSGTRKARFVVFTSGLRARDTFLMDCQTGKTWILTTGPRDILGWIPFPK